MYLRISRRTPLLRTQNWQKKSTCCKKYVDYKIGEKIMSALTITKGIITNGWSSVHRYRTVPPLLLMIRRKRKNYELKRALTDYNFFVKTYFELYADADCADFQIEFANACLADPNFSGLLNGLGNTQNLFT